MSSLLVMYIILLLIYTIGRYFNSSLDKVQVYHQKLLKLDWTDPGILVSGISTTEMLFHCVSSSVLAKGVYFNYPNADKIFNLNGFGYTRNIQPIGSVIINKEVTIISFISTACLSDVMFSISNKLINTSDGKIHEGYYTRCLENLPMLLDVLYSQQSKNIILTGHSLGGTIASVFGYLLLKYNFNINVITFGSPKFGNRQLKHYLERKLNIVNILNHSDPVIHKPSKKGYIRIGKEIYGNVDTGNDNVNHGIKVYHEIVREVKISLIKKRGHRFDEILSRWILDLFG
jgi:hypothetical protein